MVQSQVDRSRVVYVAGTFSKWTSLTQIFLLLRGRSPHYFSSNSRQKSECLGTPSSQLLAFRQNKGAGYIQWTMLDVPAYFQKKDSADLKKVECTSRHVLFLLKIIILCSNARQEQNCGQS